MRSARVATSLLLCLVWGSAAGAGSPELRVLLLEGRDAVRVGAHRLIPAPGGLRVDGGPTVKRWRAPGSGPHRVGELGSVRGALEVIRGGEGLRVVNRVPMEAYLAGTLGREVYSSWEPAALRAQAVVSRTYALYQRARGGERDFDVLAGTRHQVYGGLAAETDPVRRAVRETRRQVLIFEGEPILAAFHSASGGRTASAEEVWGQALPYLRSQPVSGEEVSPDTYWRAQVPKTRLTRALAPLGHDVGPIRAARVTERSGSGRAVEVDLIGSRGRHRIAARALRGALGEGLLRSTLFEIRDRGSELVFIGSGHGHGVGMSQWGAQAMAERGASHPEILAAFYPGAELVRWEER